MAVASAPKISRPPFEKEEVIWRGGSNGRYSVVRETKLEGKKLIQTFRLLDGKSTIGWEIATFGKVGIGPLSVPTINADTAVQPATGNAFREFLSNTDQTALPVEIARFIEALKKDSRIR